MSENAPHKVRMGLGEAVLRLVHVELMYANGLFNVPKHLQEERKLIVDALNSLELDLGFDCDVTADSVMGTVDIFKLSAETSCCRVLPRDSSRKVALTPAQFLPEAGPTNTPQPAPPNNSRRRPPTR